MDLSARSLKGSEGMRKHCDEHAQQERDVKPKLYPHLLREPFTEEGHQAVSSVFVKKRKTKLMADKPIAWYTGSMR